MRGRSALPNCRLAKKSAHIRLHRDPATGEFGSKTRGVGSNYNMPVAIANQVDGPRIFRQLDHKMASYIRKACGK
jgi:hypothetical protein